MVDLTAARALAERLNNDVNLFSPLDWQDHVALAHEAASVILAMAEELEAHERHGAAVRRSICKHQFNSGPGIVQPRCIKCGEPKYDPRRPRA